MATENKTIVEELRSQVGSGTWSLLEAHARSGSLILVHSRVPLLDAAVAVAEDRTEQVSSWINDESLHRHYPADSEEKTLFNFVVVAPYVLAQTLTL